MDRCAESYMAGFTGCKLTEQARLKKISKSG